MQSFPPGLSSGQGRSHERLAGVECDCGHTGRDFYRAAINRDISRATPALRGRSSIGKSSRLRIPEAIEQQPRIFHGKITLFDSSADFQNSGFFPHLQIRFRPFGITAAVGFRTWKAYRLVEHVRPIEDRAPITLLAIDQRSWSDRIRQRVPHFGQRIRIISGVGAIPFDFMSDFCLSRNAFFTKGRSDFASIIPSKPH